MEFERKVPSFRLFLSGKDAVCRRMRVFNRDGIVQADLVAWPAAPVEKDLRDPFQISHSDFGADFLPKLASQRLFVRLAERDMAARKGKAVVTGRLLQQHTVVLNTDAGHAVGKDMGIRAEQDIGHVRLLLSKA